MSEYKRLTVFEDSFSEEVWKTTYKDFNDVDVNDNLYRVAKSAASAEETQELKDIWTDRFYDLLSQFKSTSGGRILANAGTQWGGTTLMNCFVGPKAKHDQDSLEGIFETLLSQAQTLKSEGGWGMNFSFIRPRGSFIHGIGVETPGAVKYMELFDKSSEIITSGSGVKSKNKKAKGKIRKGAMMGILSVWHPDIEEFITAKLTPNRLSKFNLSVNCTNEFMDKVVCIEEARKNNSPITDEMNKWELIFPDTKFEKYKDEWDGNIQAWKEKGYPIKVHKTITVSELWELIMSSTYRRNDPGVLFMDIANKTHCWNYGGRKANIQASNPCGEQLLPFGAVCNLASMNLTQFVDFKNKRFDLDKISLYIKYSVRFLDNINSITNAPLPEYLDSIKNRRRIGLGVMGWGSALYLLGVRFGSDKAEEIKSELMKTFTHSAIEASIELAEEKGMFSDCDPVKHSESYFFKQIGLSDKLINRIKKSGIRNSALFSIQPTGNTGILANVVSGGLEPLFLHEYIRTVICPTVPDHIKDVCPKYWEGEFKETSMFKLSKEGEDEILKGKDVNGVVFKIDKNRGLTKEVLCEDYAVRYLKKNGLWDKSAEWAVTTNDLTVEEHITDLKGFGKWIDSSMSKTVNIPNNYSYDKFKNIYTDAYKTGYLKGVTTYRAGTMTTVLSSVETKEVISVDKINKTKAPKRPKNLKGAIHHFRVKGENYYVAVGFLNDDVYEVFTGINETKNDKLSFPKEMHDGKIIKRARGDYIFKDLEGTEYHLINGHNDDNADALTRLISVSLRHGVDLNFIVHQLEKTKGEMVSFAKVLARTIKKYIKDGTVVHGEECMGCGTKSLVRQEGCMTCKSCGWSKC